VGATFVGVYAPNELDTERVMNVVRRQLFIFAYHYHRFAVHELDSETTGLREVTSPR
jgi:hypothetical protein